MKVLVTYLSKTGNTKKIADAIFEKIPCDKELKKIDEITSLEGYDLIFTGFPVWQFGPAEPARKFLEEHAAGKKIALFVTHAMDPAAAGEEDLEKLSGILEKCKAAVPPENLAGFFNCQGELSEPIANFLLKNPDPQLNRFGAMRGLTAGHPDSAEIRAAGEFAAKIMENYK